MNANMFAVHKSICVFEIQKDFPIDCILLVELRTILWMFIVRGIHFKSLARAKIRVNIPTPVDV